MGQKVRVIFSKSSSSKTIFICSRISGHLCSFFVPLGQKDNETKESHRNCNHFASLGALSIQAIEIPATSVWSDAIFGTSFEGGPLWPVWSFRSIWPKCPFPFDKIVVPSIDLLSPAYKKNNRTRGRLGRVCAGEMKSSIGRVKFLKFQTGIFAENFLLESAPELHLSL